MIWSSPPQKWQLSQYNALYLHVTLCIRHHCWLMFKQELTARIVPQHNLFKQFELLFLFLKSTHWTKRQHTTVFRHVLCIILSHKCTCKQIPVVLWDLVVPTCTRPMHSHCQHQMKQHELAAAWLHFAAPLILLNHMNCTHEWTAIIARIKVHNLGQRICTVRWI